MSSTKSSRVVNSHIVETNASGIVTIVIDDDNEESNYSISDEESGNEYRRSPEASRPAIGVRTPIPTLGSPKFINSENSQNVLIKENKTNVIVVSSGRFPADGSPFRSSLSPTSSCCSSDSMPSELTTHHNIVSKTQTHYVVINKPKPTASASATSQMPSCGSHMSSPSLEYSSKSSPTKLRLWTQPSNHSTPRSPQVIVSTRTRSHALLPPEDIESDCMDDQTFFKYLNLIPKEELRSKPRQELNTCWPLRKVNKIPKPDADSEGRLLLANFKVCFDILLIKIAFI